MDKLKLRFTYEKETKNTIRYQEGLGNQAYSSRDIAIGGLYIQKEVLLVWKIDRAFRSVIHAANTLNMLRAYRVGFRSYTEPSIDTTPPMVNLSLILWRQWLHLRGKR